MESGDRSKYGLESTDFGRALRNFKSVEGGKKGSTLMVYHSVGLLEVFWFRHTMVEGDMRCFSQFPDDCFGLKIVLPQMTYSSLKRV